jgi:hypothetical protein
MQSSSATFTPNYTSNRTGGLNLNAVNQQSSKEPEFNDYLTNYGINVGKNVIPSTISQLLGSGGFDPTKLLGSGLGAGIGSLSSLLGPEGSKFAPLTSYLGKLANTAVQGGNLATGALGGLPSLGAGLLLNTLLPKEYSNIGSFASPVLTSMLSTATGLGNPLAGFGAPVVSSTLNALGPIGSALGAISSYAGPIGMALGLGLNIYNDVQEASKMRHATKQAEAGTILNYKKNAEVYDNIWKQIESVAGGGLTNKKGNVDYVKFTSRQPKWMTTLLIPRGLDNPIYSTMAPLAFSNSAIMNSFRDPAVNQQVLTGFYNYVKSPDTGLQQWEGLDIKQQNRISSLISAVRSEGAPLSTKIFEKIKGIAGMDIDPFQMLAGAAKVNYEQERAAKLERGEVSKDNEPIAQEEQERTQGLIGSGVASRWW